MKRLSYIIYILLSVSILTSCDGYEKMLKSTDYDAKFKAAMQYYEEGSFRRAKDLLENMILYYRGKEYAEEVAWHYGQCLMELGDTYTAAYQFKTFTKRYPYSKHIEEAAYLAAYCKYLDSPVYTLDQRITKEAISELELFADQYPQNPHLPEVNNCLDELRDKLRMKDYDIAIGYYTIEAYNAAVVSLTQYLNNYPEAPNREEAMYYIIKAGYEYAINSTEAKIRERLHQVVGNFDKFATTFKDSKRMSECQDIYTLCKARLAEME